MILKINTKCFEVFHKFTNESINHSITRGYFIFDLHLVFVQLFLYSLTLEFSDTKNEYKP